MPYQIVRNDITQMKVDAIVNTANARPGYGAGIDAAVYKAAGEEELLAEREKIGVMEKGTSAVTPGFKLPVKYIIHTVGSPWVDGKSGEEDTLRSCYKSAFALAEKLKVNTLAVPLLASGSFGYPKGIALRVALSELEAFLQESDMTIYLVVFDKRAYELSNELYGDIDSYISEHRVEEKSKEEYKLFSAIEPRKNRRGFVGANLRNEAFVQDFSEMRYACEAEIEDKCDALAAPKAAEKQSLEEVIIKKGKTFVELLAFYTDQRGLTDAQLQKKANVDRRTFSKIRCGKTKAPSKITIFAFAIALELNLDETKDLLASAGLAFAPSELTDLIIQYFIEKEIYNVGAINIALFEHDQPCLGADL